jgi:hypothetical protein
MGFIGGWRLFRVDYKYCHSSYWNPGSSMSHHRFHPKQLSPRGDSARPAEPMPERRGERVGRRNEGPRGVNLRGLRGVSFGVEVCF